MATPVDTPLLRQGTSLVDRMNVSIHLRRYLKLVGRRWWLLALGLALGGGIATYRAVTAPDMFQAQSILTIAPKVKTANSDPVVVLDVMDKFYENQLQIMTGSRVTSRVHAALRTDDPAIQSPRHFRAFAEIGNGASFRMLVNSDDREYAKKFASQWAQEFIRFKNERRQETIGATGANTQQEIIRYTEKLERIREQLQEFHRRHNIGSVKETGDAAQRLLDQLLAEQTQYSTMRKLLENTTSRDIANGALVDQTFSGADRSNTGSAPASDGTDPMSRFSSGSQYRELSLQLRTKESDRDRLAATLKPKHPVMADLLAEIERLRESLQFELDFIEERRRALIASYAQNEESYKPLIAAQRTKVLDSRKIQYEYERLKEDETSYKETLDNLRRTLDSIDLASADDDQFEVAEHGMVFRLGPDRKKMILTGLAAGLLCGLALAYLLQRLDDRLELAADIEEALEEPVLGQIPLVESGEYEGDCLLITKLNQHNMFAESIRGVRSAVMLGAEGGAKQLLLVTSAVPGDGKTTFTANFAATLAIAGHRVLLVDGDLRRGNIQNYFQHPRQPGFSEILEGQLHWSDVVRDTEIPSLQIIPTGTLPPNPGELLVGPIASEFFSEVRPDYDYIVVDCPPLTAIDDTFVLASLSDGILFVVRAGQTSMRFAKTALNAVRQRGARLLGVVINGITADNPYYYYNSYYHAYYQQAHPPKMSTVSQETGARATKMAPPKRRMETASIESIARARSRSKSSREPAESGDRQLSKAEAYRARRSAQRRPDPGPGDPSSSPSPSPSASSSSSSMSAPAPAPAPFRSSGSSDDDELSIG